MMQRVLSRVRHGARAAAVVGLGMLAAMIVTPLAGFAAAPTSLCGATDTQCVITFGNARIAERQAALSKLNSRVSVQFHTGRISSANTSALVSDIAANESGLTALKATLDAAPDAKTARGDVKLIYTQFRIYAVVLPRDYPELWLDMIAHVDARLKGADPLIQDAIHGAPSGVQTQATTLFEDYQSQLSTSEAQVDAAQGIIPQLTPASFDSSPTSYATTYGSFKTDIQSAHTATRQAVLDLRQIITLLKSAGSPVATPTA